MHWSRLFIPTLRDDPGDAEGVSHRLLLRAGYIRPTGPGIYCHLFLAQRTLRKITGIVRQEIEAIGAQEMRLPAFHPADAMTAVASGELRSYKQLPQIWYQIQTKPREAPQPKSGLLRVRQLVALESISFDMTGDGLDEACRKHQEVCSRVFERCGLKVLSAEARAGSKFMVTSDDGEEVVFVCPRCGHAGDVASAVAPLLADPGGHLACEEFHTPGRKTIAEVAEFTGLPETCQMKSLVMVADGTPVLALLRGDHQLNEDKLAEVTGASEIRAAEPAEIHQWFGAAAGSLGPVGVKNMRVLADQSLQGRRNMICGANKDDYHLRNVTPGEDFAAEFCDLRQAAAGDACSRCDGAIEARNAVEMGNIRKLRRKYSEATGVRVTDPAGNELVPFMGVSSIAIERILHALAEQNQDKDGMILPAGVAPFDVVITPVFMADPQQQEAAETIYRSCREKGLDVVIDDRDLRAGVKFKDADLVGIPWRVVVGKKVPQGVVELVERRSHRSVEVPIGEVSGQVHFR